MIDYDAHAKPEKIEGQVLSENQPMLQMCKLLGFPAARNARRTGRHQRDADLAEGSREAEAE